MTLSPPRCRFLTFQSVLFGLMLLLQSSDAIDENILNPFTNNNNNNSGNGCRLSIEKNEWASGCIPAVNFVVKLVDCWEGTAMWVLVIVMIGYVWSYYMWYPSCIVLSISCTLYHIANIYFIHPSSHKLCSMHTHKNDKSHIAQPKEWYNRNLPRWKQQRTWKRLLRLTTKSMYRKWIWEY